MKKFICLFLVIGFIYGCGAGSNSTGELDRGTKGKSSRSEEAPPYGMSYIPRGSFLMGNNDQDILFAATSGTKQTAIDAFWMDQTEVTNYEYRQFVSYTRDSIMRRILGETNPEFLNEPDPSDDQAQSSINWKTKINMKDENVRAAVNSMNYQGAEALFGKRELDVRKLAYDEAWIDYQQAARLRYNHKDKKYDGTVVDAETGEVKEAQDRSSVIVRNTTMVYPDTLCWIRDYAFVYNEPFALRYFSHPSYNDYPVVGVTWEQVNAFCRWRTKMMNNAARRKGGDGHKYRLPSEVEWEYAARGGLQAQLYPWGGPYATNSEGCYLANFKPQRGKYELDGGVRTLPVASYNPNDYGLYDMAGNVAEWTESAYDENAYNFYHDMTPTYTYNATENDPAIMKRKVIRGGSWKDIAYYIQCGTRTYEFQDSARSYIGFRCVRTYLGTKANQ